MKLTTWAPSPHPGFFLRVWDPIRAVKAPNNGSFCPRDPYNALCVPPRDAAGRRLTTIINDPCSHAEYRAFSHKPVSSRRRWSRSCGRSWEPLRHANPARVRGRNKECRLGARGHVRPRSRGCRPIPSLPAHRQGHLGSFAFRVPRFMKLNWASPTARGFDVLGPSEEAERRLRRVPSATVVRINPAI